MKNLSNIEHELDMVTKEYVDKAAEAKVDKVEGKQLSTNDFTTEEKEKLNSLENYTLPMASADALGGVKIGNNMSIDANGILDIKNSLITYINDPVEFVDGSEPTYPDGFYVFTNSVTINGVDVKTLFTAETLIQIKRLAESTIYFYFIRPDLMRSGYISYYKYYNKDSQKWLPSTATNYYSVTALTTSSGLAKTNTKEYIPTENYHPATKLYVDNAVSEALMPSALSYYATDEVNIAQLDACVLLDVENRMFGLYKPAMIQTPDYYFIYLTDVTISEDKKTVTYTFSGFADEVHGGMETSSKMIEMTVVRNMETNTLTKNTYTKELATKAYVDEAVANAGGETDLEGYATEEYVDNFVEDLQLDIATINNYELMQVEQEDISETLIVNSLVGNITDTTSDNFKWSGYCIGNSNQEIWEFAIENDSYQLKLNTGNIDSYTQIIPVYNYTAQDAVGWLNTALNARSDTNKTSLQIQSKKTSNTYLVWDLQQACTPTFNYSVANNSSSNYVTFRLQGSNTRSSTSTDWTNIATLTKGSLQTYVVTTPYRYFRMKIELKGGGSVSALAELYCAYFSNVPEIIEKYKNNFTVDHDFAVQEFKNVIVPTYSNASCVTENTINGMSFEEILTAGKELVLRYAGGELKGCIDHVKMVTGTFAITDTTQTINVGFTPELVIVYHTNNNSTSVASSTSNVSGVYIPKIITKALSYEAFETGITENGFFIKGVNSYPVYYIAIG